MSVLLFILLLAALALSFWLWRQLGGAQSRASEKSREASIAAVRLAEALNAAEDLEARVAALSRYAGVLDAENVAETILRRAEAEAADVSARAAKTSEASHAAALSLLQQAKAEAALILEQAKQEKSASKADAAQVLTRAKSDALAHAEAGQAEVSSARAQAARVIEEAKQRAREIGGEAYAALERMEELQATAAAMKGVIQGYGDDYIVPTFSLLDELGASFGHTEAGANLKRSREASRSMVRGGLAAACDYVEAARRETAVRFVTDAFNGKVDSILSRVKSENHGKLEQEIKGAFHLVNRDGGAFRNARINPAYLDARIDELRWGAATHVLQMQEREEQRRLREQIREEERARREFERALKEAAQEEKSIKKAMERVQEQVAKATDEQRAEFEAKLLELEAKLVLAEEKGKRALSMAQQTKVGHVYVISNVGSFGESVFKIGMTRRLEPTDRVRELGDASVPFEFDIHAMIYSEDAPALERSLHLHFMRSQLNKVNPRKEFFRLGVDSIRAHVDSLGIVANWTLAAKAHDYRESLRIEQALVESPLIEREWTERQIAVELAEEPVNLAELVEAE